MNLLVLIITFIRAGLRGGIDNCMAHHAQILEVAILESVHTVNARNMQSP